MTINTLQHKDEYLLIVTNKSGSIIECTNAFRQLISKVVPTIDIDTRIQNCIHPEDIDAYNRFSQEVIATDKTTVIDIRLKVTRSSYQWFEVTLKLVGSDNIIVSFYLIDKRKKEYLKLIESLSEERHFSEMKSKFVSTTSHEFRTPLSIIKSSAEVMLMFLGAVNDEKISAQFNKYLVNINNEADRLTRLINDVLIMQKADTGVIACNKISTDLVALIKNTIERQSLIQKDGRVIDIEVVGEAKSVYIDPILFEYILDNLFTNAFKYSANSPNPICKVTFTSVGFYIAIKDFGIGIPENQISHLYSMFFRGNNVGQIKGTGLGLNLVKKLVELHDGNIMVSSVQNVETEFILSFMD